MDERFAHQQPNVEVSDTTMLGGVAEAGKQLKNPNTSTSILFTRFLSTFIVIVDELPLNVNE